LHGDISFLADVMHYHIILYIHRTVNWCRQYC